MHQVRFREAIALNTRGTSMMAMGEYTSAATVFRSAISIISDSVQRIQVASRNFSEESRLRLGTTQAFSEEPSVNTWQIFDKCFVALHPDQELEACSLEDVELYTAAFGYNFALACHLSGVHGALDQKRTLQTSLHWYKICLSLLQRNALSVESEALFLAVCNNIASLSLELYDYSTMQMCRNYMGNVLAEKVEFYPTFFEDNWVASIAVCERAAPAA